MIIDNRDSAKVYKIYNIFYLIPASVLLVYSLIDFPKVEFIWLAVSIVCFGMLVWYNLPKPHYIHFDEDNKVFLFRYCYAGLIKFKNREIIIPREELYGYEILESLKGRRKALVLKVQRGTQVSRYQPIFISAMIPRDISNLKAILDKQIEENWE